MLSFFAGTVYSPQSDKKDRFDILKFFGSLEYAGKTEAIKFTEQTKPPIIQPKDLPVSILVN